MVRKVDGRMDGQDLVTCPLFCHLHDIVRCDGWMDGMHGMDVWIGGWSWPCQLPPSSHLHDIVRCDGGMDGLMGGGDKAMSILPSIQPPSITFRNVMKMRG